jgi:hypothetical protein
MSAVKKSALMQPVPDRGSTIAGSLSKSSEIEVICCCFMLDQEALFLAFAPRGAAAAYDD